MIGSTNNNSMERKVKLKSLNLHITCKICKGYLIDATTVTECLHTFCKSCLVKHLEEDNTCPTCEDVIHVSHPLNYISYDRTMQDIVYKLCPNLQLNEIKREKEFYRKRGLPYPKANIPANNHQTNSNDREVLNSRLLPCNDSSKNGRQVSVDTRLKNTQDKSDCHRSDEQVNIVIENIPGSLEPVKRKYIRCSAHTTVNHIKKFVAKKLFDDYNRYNDIDILCDDHLLGKDHSLKFVAVTRWRYKEPPLKLQYRKRVDF